MELNEFLRNLKPYMAEDGNGGGGDPSGDNGDGNNGGNNGDGNNGNGGFEFDYEKLANIVAGKQSVTEESVLKGYFKNQGLTEDEMKSAIASFKEKKKASTPDIAKLNQDIADANKRAIKSEIAVSAYQMADSLGLNAKVMPYVIKMADISNVVGEDGKVNEEELKNSINKVLEDVPQLKPSKESGSGFSGQVGSDPNNNNGSDKDAALRRAMGLK